MTEQEVHEALKAGAVIFADEITGEHKVAVHYDLPPDMLEAILKEGYKHYDNCPDCIEADAYTMLIDAAWWWEEGNEEIAYELQGEAEHMQQQAGKMRAARMAAQT